MLPHGGKAPPLATGGKYQVKVYGTDANGNVAGKNNEPPARLDSDYYRVLRIASNVNSKYNALAFQLNKQYRNGFSALANFT